jgi:uncharacterized RmlC-like cupin family protein
MRFAVLSIWWSGTSGMVEDFACFSDLISPVDPKVFLDRYWGKEFLHVSRSDGQHSEWLTLRDIDLLFQFENLPAATCNVVSMGAQIPVEDWSRERSSDRGHYRTVDLERLLECYLKGATLILNQAQRAIPALSRICRLLSREFGLPVWSNIYITPPEGAGFAKHEDDHEVLIFQVFGAKLWTIFANGKEPVNLQLTCGDILYLPRSTPHAALAARLPSIHATFGISAIYGFDLVSELAVAAKQDPSFQTAVPIRSLDTEALKTWEKEFAENVRSLLLARGLAGLLEQKAQVLEKSEAGGWPGRFSDVVHLGDVSPTTVVCRRSGMLFKVHDLGETLELRFAEIVNFE